MQFYQLAGILTIIILLTGFLIIYRVLKLDRKALGDKTVSELSTLDDISTAMLQIILVANGIFSCFLFTGFYDHLIGLSNGCIFLTILISIFFFTTAYTLRFDESDFFLHTFSAYFLLILLTLSKIILGTILILEGFHMWGSLGLVFFIVDILIIFKLRNKKGYFTGSSQIIYGVNLSLWIINLVIMGLITPT